MTNEIATADPRATAGPLRRVTGLSTAEFAERHWSTAPLLVRAADRDGFADLFDLDAVDELVSERGLRTPFLRMARDGKVLDRSRFTRSGGAGAEINDQAADDLVLSEVAGGTTLVLQGLHRTWPPLVRFAGSLAHELGHPVQVNAYLTPAQSTGFDPHYDVHDVFVLQVAGRKHWRIHAPVLEAPLRDQPWDQRRDAVAGAAKAEPVIDVVLEPGDTLYLPRGYLHSATALGEVSAHLTFGVQPVTRAFVAEQVLELLSDDVELRRSLPVGADLAEPGVLADDLKAAKEALHAAIDRLDDARVAAAVDRHLADRTRPEPVAPFAQLSAADRLGPDDVVRVRTGVRCRFAVVDDGLRVTALGKSVIFPAAAADAVRRLLGGEPTRLADLPGVDTDDAVVVARRLLREGLVILVLDAEGGA